MNKISHVISVLLLLLLLLSSFRRHRRRSRRRRHCRCYRCQCNIMVIKIVCHVRMQAAYIKEIFTS